MLNTLRLKRRDVGQVDLIYMDFSKACDRLDNGIILMNLFSFPRTVLYK